MYEIKYHNKDIAGCNFLITGGAGFIGSHLVNHLIDDRDCNVIVVDNLITGQKKWINPKAKFIYHDITHQIPLRLKL